MDLESWPRVEPLFNAALALPAEQRASFLAEACGEDTDLRRTVEKLIEADEGAGEFLARPALARLAVRSPDARNDGEPDSRFPPGTMVAERYQIGRLLGRGGMGEVYRADDLKLMESVALKFLPEPMAGDAAMLSRFWREVKIARQITHPNVCRVYDVGDVDGHHFLSMEFITGEDLASRMRRVGRPGREDAMQMIRDVCRGLAAVHERGILHCDLKPANLMIDRESRARLTDFGIARLSGNGAGAESRRGTPAYMAPEQHAGREVSVRTDLYALGLVMYELLTGQRPFRGDSAAELGRLHREEPPVPLSDLVADLEPSVERLILRCLAKDPRERPSSVREVTASLWPDAERGDGDGGSSGIAPSLHQLPPPPADFTGREDELTELRAAVESGGVTISGLQGMGGVGKTTLALKLAEELSPLYPDAQVYLDLKGVSREPLTPVQAMAHVIHAFRPKARLPETDAGIAGQYRSVLHGRSALLMMDNAASREQVEPLIPPCGTVLLVTSRRSFVLPGLMAKRLDILSSEDAVSFLRRVVPEISDEAEDIARLCGYLPIALRLASGTLAERRDLEPSEYARRLAEGRGRLELIEASLALSFELLNTEQQRLWSALAVFPDSFDAAAAAAIWGLAPDRSEDQLGELVRCGLVEWIDGRYRLHDLARLFAEHQLDEVRRFDVHLRHAEHFVKVMKEADTRYLEGGERLQRGLAIFDTERANLRAGQAWAKDHAGDDQVVARLCSDYPQTGRHCLWIRLPTPTWIRWQESGLMAARRLNDRVAEGSHLVDLGAAYARSGDSDRCIKLGGLALAIAQEVGDRRIEYLSFSCQGSAYMALGEPHRAIKLFMKALSIAQDSGDRRVEGRHLGSLGEAYTDLGNPRRAIELYEQGVLLAREEGDQRGEGTILCGWGWAYMRLGEPRRAVELFQQSLVLSREIGDRFAEGHLLGKMAWAYANLGTFHRAIELAHQARVIACDMRSRYLESHVLGCLGRTYVFLNEPRRAFELLEQSLAISQERGDRLMEGLASWYLGLAYEQDRELTRAVSLMDVRVDYERAIGHADAEAHAARVEEIRARIPDSDP